MKNLTPEDLTKILCLVEAAHPGPGAADEDYKVFGLSTEVLRRVFGNDWTNEVVFRDHTQVRTTNRPGRLYFRTEAEGDDQYRYQQRAVDLAELVYNLQNIEGIGRIIQDIQDGNLPSSFAELECAALLRKAGVSFRFVAPSGVKGSDYDAEVDVSGVQKINVEFKSKSEQTTLNRNTLKQTLRDAKDQIPKNEPGVLFVRLPEDWLKDEALVGIVDEVLQEFFRRTNRVIAVVFRWEEWVFLPDKTSSIEMKFRMERNSRSELVTSDIQSILDRVETRPEANWTDFRSIVRQS